MKSDNTDKPVNHVISSEFIRLVENKDYSMFHLITEEEYEKGLALLKIDYEKK